MDIAAPITLRIIPMVPPVVIPPFLTMIIMITLSMDIFIILTMVIVIIMVRLVKNAIDTLSIITLMEKVVDTHRLFMMATLGSFIMDIFIALMEITLMSMSSK